MSKSFLRRFATYSWLLLPLLASPLHYAHAYVDPGTGSYAIQIIVGALFGGTYALKSFGGRLVTKLKKNGKPVSESKAKTKKTKKKKDGK